jgi:hypothetical protein
LALPPVPVSTSPQARALRQALPLESALRLRPALRPSQQVAVSS